MLIPLDTLADVENFMLKTPEIDYLRHFSKLYSAEPHLSGDLPHAQRIQELWQSYGIPSELVRYDVLQNFPISSSLSLHAENGTVKYQASLLEPAIKEDPTSSPANGYAAFHGFSANGDVYAELVYANFGTIQDFQLLAARGISVKDKIVICKYSKIFRGLKVRAAEKFGAAGVIIYSDPQEDGDYTIKNGYLPYPDGPARHPDAIQRGSVDYFSISVGDPTTPGYPSLPGDGTERRDPKGRIPSIPSLPISYADALPFLRALNGCGLAPEEMGADWRGGLDVRYYTGPSEFKVALANQGEYVYQPIYNVIGTVEGAGKELVVLGNHHDSWTVGAVDPVSGGACMNEVARGLGKLSSMGWVPERTIILASWDNEEYGLLGSTEWAEENAEMLSERCIAYINVDGATNGGTAFSAVGSPLLSSVLQSVAKKIPSPYLPNSTIYTNWLSHTQATNPNPQVPISTPHLGVMGTGSDYTVFFDHLGIPSLDFGFNSAGKSVFHYHSNYDSFYWMEKYGDVGFEKHLAVARLFGVLAVRMAGSRVLPFSAKSYVGVLEKYAGELKTLTNYNLDIKELESSIALLKIKSQKLDKEAETLEQEGKAEDEELSVTHSAEISSVNKKYRGFEPGFLCKHGGLPGREWFKHMIFAPGLWKGYEGVVFPGLVEAIDDKDMEEAAKWVSKIAKAVRNVAASL